MENNSEPQRKMGGVTIVTGIWDIKRDELTEGWTRSFDHYIKNFIKLLKTEDNMIIFIEEKYRPFIEGVRSEHNTLIITRELDWFKSNQNLFDSIQRIRTNPDWYQQSGWLSDSTQAKLEMYNPLVMSKMFLLNDASIFDPFDSAYLVWVDGALTNTVHEGYFWKDKVIPKLKDYFKKFSFVCFPYDGKVEIHGFEYENICKYAEGIVDKVARGGIFGGPKEVISTVNGIYYSILSDTLNDGYMGTEESIFTIMVYKYPELFQYYEINSDGLIATFFENVKNKDLTPKVEGSGVQVINTQDVENTALYVLTFNFPEQFSKLCQSFKLYDEDFLNKPKKFLVNNSTDTTVHDEYERLCEQYGFEHLVMNENLGICRGRQYIAQHAHDNNFDYHMFFEDDMFFYGGNEDFCRNGFIRKIPNLYNKVLKITWDENFDFLKMNFSEFFGDNRLQWAWHNVPQNVREKLFPEKPLKTNSNINNAPFLKYKNIKSYNGLPYATGEIYYCNWPQVISKQGNQKMFIDEQWQHPFEQTWMSHMYQEVVKGDLKGGILLATPTEHNRFSFYKPEERKEC
jgi:hypothetical protein